MDTTGIIGSAAMDLEVEFRLTVLNLATKLSEEECRRIAYVSSINFNPSDIPREYGSDFRLYLVSTLESQGKMDPLNLEFLRDILMELGRKDLVDIINKYKKKPVYEEVKKKSKQKIKQTSQLQGQAVDSTTPSSIMQYKETYAILLTQFAQMTLLARPALETCDIPKIKEIFSSAGDAVSRTLRKLSLDEVSRDSTCTSASSSSGDNSGS